MKKFLLRTAAITAAVGLGWFVSGAVLMGIGPAYPIIANIAAPCAWFYAMYKNAVKTIDEYKAKPQPVMPIQAVANSRQPENTHQRQHTRTYDAPKLEISRPKTKRIVGRWRRTNAVDNQREAA